MSRTVKVRSSNGQCHVPWMWDLLKLCGGGANLVGSIVKGKGELDLRGDPISVSSMIGCRERRVRIIIVRGNDKYEMIISGELEFMKTILADKIQFSQFIEQNTAKYPKNLPFRPLQQKRHPYPPRGSLRFRSDKAQYQSRIHPPLNVYLNVKISRRSPNKTRNQE